MEKNANTINTNAELTSKSDKLKLYSKLLAIQNELKVPKANFNTFSNCNYRTIEDIFEYLKPLLAKYNAVMFFEDDVVIIGDNQTIEEQSAEGIKKTQIPNAYLKATAYFIDCETGMEIKTSSFAKEALHGKMTADQSTIAASTYARKAALSALLSLDNSNGETNSSYDNNNLPNSANAKATNKTQKKSPNKGWGSNQCVPAYDEIPLPQEEPYYRGRRSAS